jgi:hypothetical protein
LKFEDIDLKQLNLASQAEVAESEFCFSYPLQSPSLIDSIHEVGQVQPILVCFKNGSYQLVCGHRRVLACQELNFKSVLCGLIPERPPVKLLELAIYDNLSTRGLNAVEKAIIISKLQNYLSPEQIILKYLPLLKLQPHYKILDKFLHIAGFEDKLKQAIVSGKIHEELSGQLSKWSVADQMALVDLFNHIPFSIANQQELIINIWEIGQREGMQPAAVLNAKDLLDILADSSLSNPQKGHKLRQYLAVRRYPKLSAIESKFRRLLNRLQLPKGTKLIPPAYFERSKFKLECEFNRPEQLEQQLSVLSEKAHNPAWQDIFRLGRK